MSEYVSEYMRFRLETWISAALLACLLCACGPESTEHSGSVADPGGTEALTGSGGTLTMALEGGFSSLDPLRVTTIAQRQVALSIMDPLFDVDTDGELKPVLATGYEVMNEGRRYEVTLREGVKFHDGTSFDAEAVVLNIERLRDPDNACRCLPMLTDLESVEAIGTHRVAFNLSQPNAALPAVLAAAPGLMLSPAAIRDSEDVGRAPVGAGAFKFESWEDGHRITLVRNDDYWQDDLPHLERVVFKPLASEDSRQSALRAGDVDALQSPNPRFSAQYADHPDYRLMTSEGFGSVFLMMNTREPPFDDRRVRRAVAHATDREKFVTAVFRDQYPIANSMLGPGHWAYTEVSDYPSYDPDKARQLLDDYGKPVKFSLKVLNSPYMVLSSQALQQMWSEVGIEAEIEPIEGARFVRDALNHQFEMAFFRFVGRPDPDLNYYRAFHSDYAGRPSTNYTQYSNPEMDRLLERGRRTLERDDRIEIYRRVSQLVAEDVPVLYLFHTALQTMMAAHVDPGPNIPDAVLRLKHARVGVQ